MGRLFLHGKSDRALKLKRIHEFTSSTNHHNNHQNTTIDLADVILLSGFDFDEHDVELNTAICSLFQSNDTNDANATHHHRWTEVKLQNCKGRKIDQIIESIIISNCVERLIILDNNAQHRKGKTIQRICNAIGNTLSISSSLQSFMIRGCFQLTSEHTKQLAKGISQSKNLKELSIQGILTTDEIKKEKMSTFKNKNAIEGLANGLRNNTTLEHIDLDGCNISDMLLSKLLLSLISHPLLKQLNLKGNRCRSMSVSTLQRILQNNHLQHLNLSCQYGSTSGYVHDYDDGESSDEDEYTSSYEEPFNIVPLLTNVLETKKNTSLQSLILSDNKLNGNDMTHLTKTLSENHNIKEIDLTNCYITQRSFMIFSMVLPEMKGLRRLILDGQQKFCKCSGSPKSLKKLSKKICTLLLQNVSPDMPLEYIILPYGIDSTEMDNFLQFNQMLRQVLHNSNTTYHNNDNSNDGAQQQSNATTKSIPMSLWPVILDRVNTIVRRDTNSHRDRDAWIANIYYCILHGQVQQLTTKAMPTPSTSSTTTTTSNTKIVTANNHKRNNTKCSYGQASTGMLARPSSLARPTSVMRPPTIIRPPTIMRPSPIPT